MLRHVVCAVLLTGGAIAPALAQPCTVTPDPSWKNAITVPADPFRAETSGYDPGWVKFTILTCDPSTVYFQDGSIYEFHYPFATEVLDPFLGLSPAELDAVTLFNDGREALFGAVLSPPRYGTPAPAEYGIQFVSDDPLDPQEVVDRFHAVQSAVTADPGTQAFYMPSFEQLASAEQNAAFFEANGITISSPARWLDDDICHSEGWALGRLKSVPAAFLQAAFANGALTSSDIVLTDGVPANMPLVAGVLSLAPATPNSHVVILANTFQVPFVFLGEEDAALAQQLVGRRIVLEAYRDTSGLDPGAACAVRLIDVEDELTEQQVAEIVALKDPPPLNIAPVAAYGAYGASTNVLGQPLIDHFGGKAANFGVLRRSIPASSPVSLGISFDLWTEFMDQTLPGGLTLRQTIDAALAPYTTYPPSNMQALAAALDDVRDMVRDDTAFTPAQQAAIVDLLQSPQYGFDPAKNLRFRSSTNVEDIEQFTGAGLYDSYSGCLADDLDADSAGPSACDPAEPEERGVFRAIRRVYRSFYNDNAFLERLRHGVDEHDVGMALLVHHSFPDEIELANGVATYQRRAASPTDSFLLVSQAGASPVTQPEPGAVPEQVVGSISPSSSVSLSVGDPSNLVPLGATVMDWTADYEALAVLLRAAADRYAYETGKSEFVLDFEYKKLSPGGGALPAGGLVVKQIRELPQPDDTPSVTPFLLNEPFDLTTPNVAPGRAKARWSVETHNMWLDAATLNGQSIYRRVAMEFTDGCRILQWDGAPSDLPGASHAYSGGSTTTDSWVLADLPNPRTYELTTGGLGDLVSPAESPFVTLRDLAVYPFPGIWLTTYYQDPVPAYPGAGFDVGAEAYLMEIPGDTILKNPVLEPEPGVTITTELYERYEGICAGCTPHASHFGTTTIEGLTSQPIVLDGYYSQSWVATTHAFTQTFRWEPILDPGVPLETLDELEALGIRVIEVYKDVIDDVIDLRTYSGAEIGETCALSGPAGDLDASSALTIARGAAGALDLSWGPSCASGDDDFAIYEGPLGDFASHAPLTCSTGGALSATIDPSPGDAYYLVVPRNAHFEGSHGEDGDGFERAPGVAACAAQEIGVCP